MLERVAGIEPASSAWKAEVIAIIRYPHMVPTTGIELVTYWLQVSCSTYWAKSALVLQGSDITDQRRVPPQNRFRWYDLIFQSQQYITSSCVNLFICFYFMRIIHFHLKYTWQYINKFILKAIIKCRFLYHTIETTKPARWRVLLKFNCAWFASRYSFAKHSWIEAVYWQKCNNFFIGFLRITLISLVYTECVQQHPTMRQCDFCKFSSSSQGDTYLTVVPFSAYSSPALHIFVGG